MSIVFCFQGIHALARQWNAVIIGSTRTETMFKSGQRKHVVGRGVLTRKDMAILIRDQNRKNTASVDVTKEKTTGKKTFQTVALSTEEMEKSQMLIEHKASSSGFYIMFFLFGSFRLPFPHTTRSEVLTHYR